MSACVSSRTSTPEYLGPGAANVDTFAAMEGCCTSCCTCLWHPMASIDKLPAVIAAWSHLSGHVRQAIITLVEAAIQSDSAKR